MAMWQKRQGLQSLPWLLQVAQPGRRLWLLLMLLLLWILFQSKLESMLSVCRLGRAWLFRQVWKPKNSRKLCVT